MTANLIFPKIQRTTLTDCLVIGLISYLIRAITIGWHGFSDTEAQGIGIARLSTVTDIITAAAQDGNPPLFHFIIRLWGSLFGWTDFSLKGLALIFSGIFPPLVYLVILKHLGRKMAMQTAILASFCPPLICTSNLLRPHSLVIILTFLATEQLFVLISKPDSTWQRFKYGLMTAALVYCHMLAINIPLAHGFYIVLAFCRRWLGKKELIGWFIGSVIAAIFFLPWLYSIFGVLDQSSNLWQAHINPMSYYLILTYMLINGSYAGLEPYQVIIPVIICAFAIFYQPIRNQLLNSSSYIWLRQFYWIGLSSFAASYLIFAVAVHVIRDRYVSHLIIFILLLFVTAMHRLTFGKIKALSIFLPLLICISWWLPQLNTLRTYSNACVYQILQQIIPAYKSNDLIVCALEVFAPEFTRELPADVHFVSFPDTKRMDYVEFNGLDKRIRAEQSYCNMENIMRNTLERGGSIWFIESALADKHASERKTCEILKEDDFGSAELLAARRLREWLLAHASVKQKSRIILSTHGVMLETVFAKH
jgi:hypothetical protein